jgi:DNA polymerase-1
VIRDPDEGMRPTGGLRPLIDRRHQDTPPLITTPESTGLLTLGAKADYQGNHHNHRNFSNIVNDPMASRPTLYILDAYSLIYQVFHAIPVASMTSPTGEPTNAVFGIFRDLLNILKTRKPDYLAAAFDGAGKVDRSNLYAEYKSNRAEMPIELQPQIAMIKRVVEGFEVPVLMHEGAEADDIIATLAKRGNERGLDVVICTADKDARQLLNEQTRILNLRTGKFLDVEGLKADWGIAPDQVIDLLSLTGDAVDNVPGVPGIGQKTATTLLQEFGTVDNLLANINKVSGAKRKENLEASRETLKLGRQLIALTTDLDLKLNWDNLTTTPYNAKALKQICLDCGFHTFLAEIGDAKEPEKPWDYAYNTIDTPEALAAFVMELEAQPSFCFDSETTDLDTSRADIVGLAFSWQEGSGYYIPVLGPMLDRKLDEELVLKSLKPALMNSSTKKIGQNVKYDMLVLRRAGIEIQGPVIDTMVLSYLLESGERNHGLDQLSQRLLDHTMIPISDLIGKGKKQLLMSEIDVESVARYAGEDADATLRISNILTKKIETEGLTKLYDELEGPLIRILADMEAVGIKVDVQRLQALSSEFAAKLNELEAKIFHEAGRPFNIGSLPQLREILFDELKLPVTKKTPKGEPSTDVEVLEALADRHPLPGYLIEHRQISKLKSTYLDALALLADSEGRVHTSFNQVVAATGRLSSSDPNLQNIPIRTDMGGQIRQAFIAGHQGWSLLTADYSQIELRVLAHYTEDPALVRAFANDHDIHTAVASRIFGVPESQIDSSQRRVAKTVNFGVIYGISAFGLARSLKIPQSDAALFIDAYFKEYAGVEAFMQRTLEGAAKNGRVETILGRRRAITGIRDITGRKMNQPEREAFNAVIQGSAADLIKRAMILVDKALHESSLQARLLLQIHDELVFEAPDDELPALAELVRTAMTSALELKVPIRVDISTGPNWLDLTDL